MPEEIQKEEEKMEKPVVVPEVKPEEVKQPEQLAPIVEQPKVETQIQPEPEKLETPKVEAKVEEKEALSQDIKATKEELAVIKEVRDELVAVYAHYNEEKLSKENLSKEFETIKAEKAKVDEQLNRYVKAEQEFNAKMRLERVERLSVNFKKLGQDKTVEQLSAKDDETIAEFEKIVDAAIKLQGDTKVMPSVTVPSSSVSVEALKASDVEKPSKVEMPAKKTEKLTNNRQFFSGICNDLTKEQTAPKRNASVKRY